MRFINAYLMIQKFHSMRQRMMKWQPDLYSYLDTRLYIFGLLTAYNNKTSNDVYKIYLVESLL